MGYAEFEEKEFEQPLYNQLTSSDGNVWTPGQCFEAYIGIDYAGNVYSNEFWKRFGGYIPNGVILNDYNMGYIWKRLKKKRMLPDFSLNLFIQAKRPYVHSGNKTSAIYSKKHYSFNINQRQQKILEQLNKNLRNRVLLVYAAPAFGTHEELYRYTREKNIICNTSFPKVNDLSGHSSWYYCDATSGIACSEPEEETTISIFELIEEFILMSDYAQKIDGENDFYSSVYENLSFLSNTIVRTLEDNFNEDAQVQFFFSQLKKSEDFYYSNLHFIYHHYILNDNVPISAIQYFMDIAIFCDVFNLDWFALN